MSIQNKHFLNTPEFLVIDSLQGLCDLNPHLSLDVEHKVVYLTSLDRSKVALVCGGGSGHEPAHAGFVGDGILDAAVCGNVFASPNASQVRRGIELVDNDKGTVIIVKNYTGDVLNFGLAKEQYAALHPEQSDRVKFVIVGEDVAVGKTQGAIVGRRGLAGTVLVYKIAGALAKRGASLTEVYTVAQWVSAHIGTIGVGLEHCHVPGTAPSPSHLSSSEIEIGMGIHNERGNKRISPVPPLNELIPQLLDLITSTTDKERSFLPFQGKDKVVLLVNNLGGLSELELGGIVAETRRALDKQAINIKRILSGTFMTSLNMPGFSITLLLLPQPNDSTSPQSSLLLSLLDQDCNTPGWKWSAKSPPSSTQVSTTTLTSKSTPIKHPPPVQISASDPKSFIAAIERACKALIAAEPEITHLDTIAGDGDCGTTLKAGAEGVLAKIADETIHGDDIVGSVIAIAQVAEDKMGGTSGALYSIFFSALAQGLQSCCNPSSAITYPIWAQALSFTLAKLYTYTLARPPSRTLVDPLAAFIEGFQESFTEAVDRAKSAAEATKDVDAKAGRSAYVEGDRLKEQKVVDPGAWGVKTIVEGLLGNSK